MENNKTSRLNGLIIGGIIVTTIITIFSLGHPDLRGTNDIILAILFTPIILSIVGIFMVLNNKLTWGYRFILIGAVLCVPIGLITVFGVLKAKESADDLDFEKRRMELKRKNK